MVRSTDSAVQRLQVGLIGLLVVLLFVSLASMLTDRAGGPQKPAATTEVTKKADDEPVVDMGVTPVVPEQPDKQPAKTAPPAANQ